MDKIKKLFQSNDSKRGSYTLAMTSIVIAIVIIFNMIVNLIPENKRQFDISSTNIYEISSKSERSSKKLMMTSLFMFLQKRTALIKGSKLSSINMLLYQASFMSNGSIPYSILLH